MKAEIQFSIAVADEEIAEIQLIDVDNKQYTLKLRALK